jgi:hypothetical protein
MMGPQIFEHPSTSSLSEICESAARFGLTPDEIWETVLATPDSLPADVREAYVDELSGELARRLVEKQRGI